jgi:hypothetical protein
MWLIKGDFSHQIISCNIHEDNGLFQIWVTRPNGKSMKIDENKDRNIVQEIKDAIDYAIEHNEPALRLA